MGLQKGEPPEQNRTLHRDDLNTAAAATQLGMAVGAQLNAYGTSYVVVNEEGYVLLVNPRYVRVQPPTEAELVEEMVQSGATDEEIVEALEHLESAKKEKP